MARLKSASLYSLPSSTSPSMTFGEVWRGEHQVYAELWDRRNRKIATTDTITFFVRQYSILSPARAGDGGGTPGQR